MFKFLVKCVSVGIVFVGLGGIAIDPRSSAIVPLLVLGTLGLVLSREGRPDGN